MFLAVAGAEELRSDAKDSKVAVSADAKVAKVGVTSDAKVGELPGRFTEEPTVGEPRLATDRGPPLPEMQIQEDEDSRMLRSRVRSDVWQPPDERSDSDAIGPGNALERRQTPWMTRRSWLRRQRQKRLAKMRVRTYERSEERASGYERSEERRAWAPRPPRTSLSDARALAPVEPQADLQLPADHGAAVIGGYAQLRQRATDLESQLEGRATTTEEDAREAMDKRTDDVNIEVIPVDPFCCGADFDPSDDGSRGNCEHAMMTHEKEYDPAKFDQYRSMHCGAGLAGLLAVAGLLCLRD